MIKAGPSFFMEWPKGKPESAVLMCASCARPLDDRQRLDAYHAGQWQPTANFSGIRGYHMNFLYSPWPCKKGYINRLHQMATEWERAKAKGRESLKVIINTGITEPWKAQVENVPDKDGLLARCEPYPCEVPAGAVYLTIGVDTQKNYLEYEVKGWGISEESWGIQTAKLWGNPHTAEPWAKLREILTRTWRHESGALLRISCGLIDSGGQVDSQAFAEPVYKFVRTLQDRFIFASKGSSTIGAPLVVGSPQKSGILLQLIGTDVAKSTIYERLAMQSKGPGYCHFPKDPERGYVEEYFRQLTAEGVSLEGKKRVWVKLRDRNEGLDLAVLNHAAFAIRNVNLEAVARSIKPSPENGVEKPVRRVTTIKI
jgi:phage terminase large subunit GpA-like protein